MPIFGTVFDMTRAMKIALPDWQGRISPVFDVAAHLLVAEVAEGRVEDRRNVLLVADDIPSRVRQVANLEVDVLICGAISWPLEMALVNAGIEVISQNCGEVEQVLAAFAMGRLTQDAFLMPGCCGRRRRRGFRGPERR